MLKKKDIIYAILVVAILITLCIVLSVNDRIIAVVTNQNGDNIWYIANISKTYQKLIEHKITWWNILNKDVYIRDFYYPFGRYITGVDLDTSLVTGVIALYFGKGLGHTGLSIAYNFPLFFNIILDILVLYYILIKLKIKKWLSIVGSVLPLFFPFYAIEIQLGHLLHIAYWPFLLLIYFVSKLLTLNKIDIKTSLFLSISSILLIYTNMEYAYFSLVIGIFVFPIVCIILLLLIGNNKIYLKHLAINTIIAITLILVVAIPLKLYKLYFPNWYMGILSFSRMGFRPFDDLQLYSMNILSILHRGGIMYIGWSALLVSLVLLYLIYKKPPTNILFLNLYNGIPKKLVILGIMLLIIFDLSNIPLHHGVHYFTIFFLVFVGILILINKLSASRFSNNSYKITEHIPLNFTFIITSVFFFSIGILLATATSQYIFQIIFYSIIPSARVYFRAIGMLIPLYVLILITILNYYVLRCKKNVSTIKNSKQNWTVFYYVVTKLKSNFPLVIILLITIVIDLYQPLSTNYPIFNLRQLFTQAHFYLKEKTSDINTYSIADFSKLRNIAWGAYGGMISAAFMGGKQGISLDCSDNRFINTFYSYGGKYIITDKSSIPCFNVLIKNNKYIHLLETFTDGSAILELKHTLINPIGKISNPEKSNKVNLNQTSYINPPMRLMTNQIFYPMLSSKGILFKNFTDTITVTYKWEQYLLGKYIIVKEATFTKPLYANPLFFYQESNTTYLWLTDENIYRALQPISGVGVTTPGKKGSYKLEIEIINSSNKVYKKFITKIDIVNQPEL